MTHLIIPTNPVLTLRPDGFYNCTPQVTEAQPRDQDYCVDCGGDAAVAEDQDPLCQPCKDTREHRRLEGMIAHAEDRVENPR